MYVSIYFRASHFSYIADINVFVTDPYVTKFRQTRNSVVTVCMTSKVVETSGYIRASVIFTPRQEDISTH
jgi:hypothetical protein